jgi:hypothetical protein
MNQNYGYDKKEGTRFGMFSQGWHASSIGGRRK